MTTVAVPGLPGVTNADNHDHDGGDGAAIPAGGLYSSATDKLFGRVTADAGAGEEIDCTAAGRALLDDATAAVQLVTLGVNLPAVAAHLNANENLSNPAGTLQEISLIDTTAGIDVDTDGCFASKRFTPNKAGWYAVLFKTTFGPVASDKYCNTYLYKNGTAGTLIYSDQAIDGINNAFLYRPHVAWVYLNGSTDYISLWCTAGSASQVILGGATGAYTFLRAWFLFSA